MLQRWDPFRDFIRLDLAAERPWRGFRRGHEFRSWAVPVDVLREDDSIVVRASLPGVRPEEIEVTVEDGLLTIQGQTGVEREDGEGNYVVRERRVGKFRRALRLSDAVDTSKAESHYEDGVLTVTFPKVEAKKAKRLEVKVGK